MGIFSLLWSKNGITAAKQPGLRLEPIVSAITPIAVEDVPTAGVRDSRASARVDVVKKTNVDTFASITNAANHAQMGEDETAWLKYLRQPIRTFRKPGITLQEENRLWHLARARKRA